MSRDTHVIDILGNYVKRLQRNFCLAARGAGAAARDAAGKKLIIIASATTVVRPGRRTRVPKNATVLANG
jgi:hypothetical protein